MNSSSKDYVGRLIKLRPECFVRMLQQACLPKAAIENCFLVSAAIRQKGKQLVCHGAHLRLLVSPADVELV